METATAPAQQPIIIQNSSAGSSLQNKLIGAGVLLAFAGGGYYLWTKHKREQAELKIGTDPNYARASELHAVLDKWFSSNKDLTPLNDIAFKITNFEAVIVAYHELYGASLTKDLTSTLGDNYQVFIKAINAKKTIDSQQKLESTKTNPSGSGFPIGKPVRLKASVKFPVNLYLNPDDIFHTKKTGGTQEWDTATGQYVMRNQKTVSDPIISTTITGKLVEPFATVVQVKQYNLSSTNGQSSTYLMVQVRWLVNGFTRWIPGSQIEPMPAAIKGLGCPGKSMCSCTAGCPQNQSPFKPLNGTINYANLLY